jgi:monoamine oxidase
MQADIGGPQTNGVNGHAADGNFDIEAIVIGAGFSGLRMLYELRKRGISGKVFESGSGVGGVCILLLFDTSHQSLRHVQLLSLYSMLG